VIKGGDRLEHGNVSHKTLIPEEAKNKGLYYNEKNYNEKVGEYILWKFHLHFLYII
tara:strand:- start:13226 stop:13393 length:168 start_codon:yes stop_codon:yes gene_type:complete